MARALLGRVRRALNELGAGALLVTSPANVRYVSGFTTPEDALVLITDSEALLFTDARYTVQAEEESRLPVRIAAAPFAAAADALAAAGAPNVAVEGDAITLSRYRELTERLGVEPIDAAGLFAPMRMIKSPGEIAHIREAARITDLAFKAALEFMRAGVSEVEVALELERVMRLSGAEGAAFEIIVASGPRGAMPHGTASPKQLKLGELVTLDFGAVVAGYHADMTRTVAIGEVGAEERRLYEAVLEAQQAALNAVAPGRSGRELDALARGILSEHGLGERFTHSLGHGTGLVIHEGPRLSQRSEDVLAPGMIVTVEPGVYIPGFTGLRIEDLAVVTETGREVLSKSPKELITL